MSSIFECDLLESNFILNRNMLNDFFKPCMKDYKLARLSIVLCK